MAGEVDAERLAAKRWRNRNSDGTASFGDEDGQTIRTHAPPSFTETDSPLPTDTVMLDTPELVDAERAGHAIRHVHTFDPDIVEPA